MEERKKLRTSQWVSIAFFFLVIPLTLFLLRDLARTRFYAVALIVILEMMIPFFVSFEHRRPQARELTVLAVLAAITVAGRTAFLPVPNFSPTEGLIMIAGIAFGAESGFVVGAVALLASNFIFGQTMFTPFQMFSYGLGGYLMGAICSAGWLPRKKLPLAITGAAMYFLLVGPLLDTSVLLLAVDADFFGWGIYLSGIPVNATQALCTFLTLYFASEPMLEKLDRIKVKYGMMETF